VRHGHVRHGPAPDATRRSQGSRASRWVARRAVAPLALDPASRNEPHRRPTCARVYTESFHSRRADAHSTLLVARGLTKRCTCRANTQPTVLCRLASFISKFSLSWRPQVNWGVSARTRCTLYLRRKAPPASKASSFRTAALVRQPDLALDSVEVAAHARRSPEIPIESLGIPWRDRSIPADASVSSARLTRARALRSSRWYSGPRFRSTHLSARALTNVAADKAAIVV